MYITELPNFLNEGNSEHVSICSLPEDAYRIDAEVDGEVVGLDILDTAGQVSQLYWIGFDHTVKHVIYCSITTWNVVCLALHVYVYKHIHLYLTCCINI